MERVGHGSGVLQHQTFGTSNLLIWMSWNVSGVVFWCLVEIWANIVMFQGNLGKYGSLICGVLHHLQQVERFVFVCSVSWNVWGMSFCVLADFGHAF